MNSPKNEVNVGLFASSMESLLKWYAIRNASPTLQKIFVNDVEFKDNIDRVNPEESSFIKIARKIQQHKYSSLLDVKAAILRLIDQQMKYTCSSDSKDLIEAILDLEIILRLDRIEFAKELLIHPPWMDNSEIKKPSQKSSSRIRCDNCGKEYQTKSVSDGTKSNRDLLFSCESFTKIFALDFSSELFNTSWEDHSFILHRSEEENWGLDLLS